MRRLLPSTDSLVSVSTSHLGVLHVNERRSGRVLRLFRPVLLGAAAATAWLALSMTAASADTGEDHRSLLSLNSTVASVVAPAPKPDPGAEAHAPSQVVLDVVSGTAGRATATLDVVSGTAYQTIAVLPSVSDVIPPDITTSLVSPAMALEDSTIAVVAATVTRLDSSIASVTLPEARAVIVDAPVAVAVQPVSTPAVTAIAPTFDPAADVLTDSPRLEGESLVDPAPGAGSGVGVPDALPRSFPLTHGSFGPSASSEAPVPTDADAPAHPLRDRDMLSVPAGSGVGSQTQSGGSGPAALVARPFQLDALTGAGPISGPLQHAPNPVSFDPGSSPD
ncbi:MAG: hypothetical protein JWQ07_5678 [Ramlibacter sp.]|nr:hypothetical protein [Ramlibacter sp.]